ncbi:MAG: hypothetical protein DI598_00680 [Pseudopedobacter saltans]|uniref:RagB/SusD family nutrient uptake outer membrane protein n=1 Tax=Pseudopedobacter saltans TaxID=151895 RepID=A0A2W5FFG4_9SPHI|nr:MAG: hypothetical protein DI598_00680 [Pseudopedobacter saltans]
MSRTTFLYILLLTTLISSCKKELNVYPTTSVVDGNIISDSASARVVLNGVYYRLANAGTDYASNPSVLWASVWEYLPSEFVGNVYYSYFLDDIYTYNFDYTSNYISGFWSYGYNLVNAANGYIKNLNASNNISASAKKELLAEGKFLRAFGNEMLLLCFGQYTDTTSKYGIILRNEFVSAETITLPRNTVKECYDSILADVDYAIENLPTSNSSKIYASKAAAKLLKARVLINRGSAADVANVINITNDIIQNENSFSLEDSLKNIFLDKGLSSNEVILGIQPYSIQNWKFQIYQSYEQYTVTDSLVQRLIGDPRSNWYYKYDSYYSVNQLTKYYNGDVINLKQTTNSEICYAMRLSEAYLLGAEAYSTQGTDLASAKRLLMEVQKRSGISNFTELNTITNAATLKLKVIKEEMINFMSENGSDWFALRRLPFNQIQTINPYITDPNRLILPIPYNEITRNNKVIQNPGY